MKTHSIRNLTTADHKDESFWYIDKNWEDKEKSKHFSKVGVFWPVCDRYSYCCTGKKIILEDGAILSLKKYIVFLIVSA